MAAVFLKIGNLFLKRCTLVKQYVIFTMSNKHLQSIYSPFASTCNVTYYGETDRHLKVRAGLHEIMSALTERIAIKDYFLLS